MKFRSYSQITETYVPEREEATHPSQHDQVMIAHQEANDILANWANVASHNIGNVSCIEMLQDLIGKMHNG